VRRHGEAPFSFCGRVFFSGGFMKSIGASLKSGNWRSLIACFLYFDTGFTVWVLLGPLAPFVAKSLGLGPAEQGLLVAVPVLSAAILRVTLGNLFQSVNGRTLALFGIALSAVGPLVLALPIVPSYALLLVLGVFLGVGGASFAVALPMAGSTYAPKVQGLVLGLAAAGNIGAVLDGFMFPGLAEHYGWQRATLAALPLLALAALALVFFAEDKSVKSGSKGGAALAFLATLVGMVVLVLLAHAGAFGSGKAGLLLLPVAGALIAIAVLPKRYRAMLAMRDTWALMLVYSITFGGFVGMSSYVSLLLVNLYQMTKVDAGLNLAAFAFTGAMLRPLGGLIADRLTGVRALLVLLSAISLFDFAFALLMPPLAGGIALLFAMYVGFGLGNGATFQLVPQRWPKQSGVMTGLIGAAGGIGGFYLPVVMGIAKESTGNYQIGFATFGVLAALATATVFVLRHEWLVWAMPEAGEPAGVAVNANATLAPSS
jgi:NNP family nitrate/nitrite transporter-like MFS transporter